MSGNAAHRSPWRSSDAIAAAVLVLGTGLDTLMPLSLAAWVPLPARVLLGGGLLALGVAMIVGARRALRRAGQSPAPGAATTQLVVDGPFRRSRHPLYLGLVIALAGLGVAFDMPWWLLLVAPAIVALRVLLIVPEEGYLEAQFGAGYRDYAARVRRWL